VHPSWSSYFEGIENGVAHPFVAPPTLGMTKSQENAMNMSQMIQTHAPVSATGKDIGETAKVMQLIQAYEKTGHHLAKLDPLGLSEHYSQFSNLARIYKKHTNIPRELDYRTYGFTEADLQREFFIDATELGGIMKLKKHWKLIDLIDTLQKIYSDKIGVEYMHINSNSQISWLREQVHAMPNIEYSKEEKRIIYERLKRAHVFDEYCSNKFKTSKRFGAEGCQGFMPGLEAILDSLADQGTEKIIIGMPHRGRLNVLADIVKRPMEEIFAEFQGARPKRIDGEWGQMGDVKYHWGTQNTKEYPNGKELTVTLLANPSHLEAVDPVVLGRVRAEQHYMNDQ